MQGSTLVLINANVVTLDPTRPRTEAVAVRNGRILDVGSTKRILGYVTDETTTMDLHGKTIVPGFIDSHVHMLGFGDSLRHLDLRNVGSIKEMQAKLMKFSKERSRGGWILGGGWDQERLSERRYPTRWDLDTIVSDQPVLLLRVCSHVGVANSKALELAEIDKEIEPLEGKIDLDKDAGKPNGIIKEEALELIRRAIPKPSLEEIEESCVLACQKAVEAGITSVNWLLSSAEELRAVQKLHSEGRLPIRVYLGVPASLLRHLDKLGLTTGFGDSKVRIGFLKVFLDGSLGGHTAALNEPYSDRHDTKGVLLYSQRKLNALVLKAHRAGLQIAIHAIGDRAVNSALISLEKALKRFPRESHRHRVEHCSVLSPALIKRMRSLGVVASVQPHFIISDFWVVSRLGERRARWVYPFKSLLRAEIVVAAGSDCPVEPIDPILGMWAAVARKDSCEEEVTAEEALRMYALNAAYASFDEDRKGSIEAGKFADLTVLSDDPCRVSPEKIRDISVEMVIMDGRIIHEHARVMKR